MKRRTLLKTAAASLAAPFLQAAAPFTIGVGTFSYHNLSIADMVTQLRALNITEIEMSHGQFMLMHPPTDAMCNSARNEFDRAAIRCVSYYAATIKNSEDIGHAVRIAKLLGATNVSGDATGPTLLEIDRRFTHEGLTFGIHNHWFPTKFAYESPDDVLQALAQVSQTVGATLDVGQMAACGHDPLAALRRLRSRLKLVHLKDVAAAGAEHNVLFGQGIVNIAAVLHQLNVTRFKGLVAIEYEKEGDVNADMRQLVTYARQHS